MHEEKLHLSIKDIQVVERQARQQPILMACGKVAMVQTSYNPLEWDYYGKFGTWDRTMHKVLGEVGDFFDENGLYIILISIIAIVVA